MTQSFHSYPLGTEDVDDNDLILVEKAPFNPEGEKGPRRYPVSALSSAYAPLVPANALAVGESSLARDPGLATASTASGQLRLTYFTAKKTENIGSVRMLTGGTAAGATPTLARIGIYSVAADGGVTLVASTANDTALFNTINTRYTKALSSTWAKVAGQRYAVGALVVSGATMPSLLGAVLTGVADEYREPPAFTGLVSGLTDLPASVAAAGISTSGLAFYAAFIPG